MAIPHLGTQVEHFPVVHFDLVYIGSLVYNENMNL